MQELEVENEVFVFHPACSMDGGVSQHSAVWLNGHCVNRLDINNRTQVQLWATHFLKGFIALKRMFCMLVLTVSIVVFKMGVIKYWCLETFGAKGILSTKDDLNYVLFFIISAFINLIICQRRAKKKKKRIQIKG